MKWGLFILFLILSSSAYADRLGEESLINQWHELSSRGKDAKDYEAFKRDHYLIDIAEDHWADLKKTNRDPNFTKDLEVASYEVRSFFSDRPFGFSKWVPAIVRYLSILWDRPFESAKEVRNFIHLVALPLLLTLILILSFKIWMWAPALRAHGPRILFPKTNTGIFGIILGLLILALFAHQFFIVAFIFLCLAITYSRRSKPALILAVAFAFVFSFSSILNAFFQSLEDLSSLEALAKGRTRLVYTQLENFNPLQRSLWISFNGERERAKVELKAAEESVDKDILSINLDAPYQNAAQVLGTYELLAAKYPSDLRIQFNLSQLYTRTQNLVKADQARLKMSGDLYNRFQAKTQMTGRNLIDPEPEITLADWQKSFSQNLEAEKSRLNSKSLLYWMIPWALLAICLYRRRSAPGLCAHTGETTSHPSATASSLYQSQKQKMDTSTSVNVRQQVDQLTRAFAQTQRRRIHLIKYIFPNANGLVLEDQWLSTFTKLFFVLLFFWMSLPSFVRLEFWPQANFQWAANSFSLPLFLIGFILWIFFFLENQRQDSI